MKKYSNNFMSHSPDARQYFPATQRNQDPILAVLQAVLPPTGSILEIASGSGEHGLYFAPRLAPRYWLPSDINPDHRSSIAAWQAHHPCDYWLPPIELDAAAPLWSIEHGSIDQSPLPEVWRSHDFSAHPLTAIVAINLIHIAPWSACLGLFAGAQRLLPPGGILYLYGPYKQNGQHTAISNAQFDASLQERNLDWGVRDLEAVVSIGQQHSLSLLQVYPMPANNLSVVFQV